MSVFPTRRLSPPNWCLPPPDRGRWIRPGGRFHAEWDETTPVTREGSLLFFFQFLEAGGPWKHHREAIRSRPLLMSGEASGSAPSRSASCMKRETSSRVPSARSPGNLDRSGASRSDAPPADPSAAPLAGRKGLPGLPEETDRRRLAIH